MKLKKEKTLKSWTKEQLVEHVLLLQQNYVGIEKLNKHLHNVMAQAMYNNIEVSVEVSKVLETWNKSGGQYYTERKNKE